MRTLFLAVALLAVLPAASACDICGCSVGGNYFGILPQFHRHFVGFRWSEQMFQSAHSYTSLKNGTNLTDEHFRTVDVLARFYPWRRLQVLTLVPYHDFQRSEEGVHTRARGIGDASLLLNYVLFDTGDSLRHPWRHTLTLGGGVKLPSGKHNLKDQEGALLNPNLQPGTGSTDYFVSATYTLRKGFWGLSADGQARLNTANRKDYRYGNRLSGSAKLFYWKNFRRVTLLPNAGVFSDVSATNLDQNEVVDNTGGYVTLATLGLDVYSGHFSAGFTFQQPVYQNLGDGAIRARNRWMATLNYVF